MNKVMTKVVITTGQGYVATADDATLPMQGSGAYASIQKHADVEIRDGGNIIFIPYDKIDHAIIETQMTTVADPTDDVCADPAPTPPTP